MKPSLPAGADYLIGKFHVCYATKSRGGVPQTSRRLKENLTRYTVHDRGAKLERTISGIDQLVPHAIQVGATRIPTKSVTNFGGGGFKKLPERF